MASPTLIGKGVFGMEAETAMIAQSISFDFQSQKSELKDNKGDTVGVAYYDEVVNINLDAKVDADTAWTGNISAVLTLQNSMPAYLMTNDTQAGTVCVDSINVTRSSGEFESLNITASFYPSITTS